MQFAAIILVAAATFGLCYLFDKGFQKFFRSKQQHRSGLAVRLNKSYSISGVVLCLLGICAVMVGSSDSKVLLYGGVAVLLMGIALCVYHLSFGIFYDEEGFVFSSIGKQGDTYRYSDICSQRLYVITGGSFVVELHMSDGKAVSIQTTMAGAYPFLDAAFSSWCRQKGIDPESCPFHDPASHQWFPLEDE